MTGADVILKNSYDVLTNTERREDVKGQTEAHAFFCHLVPRSAKNCGGGTSFLPFPVRGSPLERDTTQHRPRICGVSFQSPQVIPTTMTIPRGHGKVIFPDL